MGEQTAIQWCDATWNPVRGCTKISPGCANCYAETFSHRNPAVLGEWGPSGKRVVAAESAWKDPIKWAKKHLARVLAGEVEPRPFRIFCASLADIFEDHPVVLSVRERLWRETIPALDKIRLPDGRPAAVLLILTKRAEIARAWYDANGCPDVVWPGVTVEDQKRADERLPVMVGLPRLWLSIEPLLGPVDLRNGNRNRWSVPTARDAQGHGIEWTDPGPEYIPVSWVIVGGESGAKARPMYPDWARSLRDQCVAASVPYLFKQFGSWAPLGVDPEAYRHWLYESPDDAPDGNVAVVRRDGSVWRAPTQRGPALAAWETLTLRGDEVVMHNIGKHAAGRLLDGRTWDEVPE